jgi:hypothetical protein
MLLREARTQLVRTEFELRRLLADAVTQVEHIDEAIAAHEAREAIANHNADGKCAGCDICLAQLGIK